MLNLNGKELFKLFQKFWSTGSGTADEEVEANDEFCQQLLDLFREPNIEPKKVLSVANAIASLGEYEAKYGIS